MTLIDVGTSRCGLCGKDIKGGAIIAEAYSSKKEGAAKLTALNKAAIDRHWQEEDHDNGN